MKRFAPLFILCLIFTSCAWTYRLNPLVGEKFEVKKFNEVLFYEGPSLNSAQFHLEKPEWFTVVTPTCPEGRFSCNIALLKNETLFFKVRFDSGKEAYISYKDFYSRFAMVKNYKTSPPPPAPKDSMICEPLPYKKGSFRCRME